MSRRKQRSALTPARRCTRCSFDLSLPKKEEGYYSDNDDDVYNERAKRHQTRHGFYLFVDYAQRQKCLARPLFCPFRFVDAAHNNSTETHFSISNDKKRRKFLKSGSLVFFSFFLFLRYIRISGETATKGDIIRPPLWSVEGLQLVSRWTHIQQIHATP